MAKSASKKTTSKRPGQARRGGAKAASNSKSKPRAVAARKSVKARSSRPVDRSKPEVRSTAVRPSVPTRNPGPAATEKQVRNQAGLKAKELAFFRDLLLAKRRELVGDVHSMEQEALQTGGGSNLSNLPIHMADMGTDNYEQEFTLGLVEKDRQLLREINSALQKMRDGTYGMCEGTGKPISKARLEAQPWAKFSIEHARQLEKGMVRRI